ncbi:MAG: ergothioneine biosynthesis protein EgtB [Thermoleophilaceae bacterium]|nr:ergothioneine biosynthesis protein EgtB [Thermoleophilaceae bacterium]
MAAGNSRERYADLLEDARSRTHALVEQVSEDDMNRVHDPLMSPLVWDLGHIAAFEDLWLCQRGAGLRPLRSDLARVYDAEETPRADRGELPYLRLGDALEFMAAVRARALEVLETAAFDQPADVLNHGGFVWDMLVQHEHQHNETMLQTLKLAPAGTYAPARRETPGDPAAARLDGDLTKVTGGIVPIGDDGLRFAYDNERPRHAVELDEFEIDVLPVTNGRFSEFVADGGYARREWWSEEGWAWRSAEGVERPLFWSEDGTERSFEREAALDPSLPVIHVSWFEADAFARSRGLRLPTEREWECAASWDPELQNKRRFPWGDSDPTIEQANLDQLGFGPAPAGAFSAGAAPCGALGMIGDVWEWTASHFDGYPGFGAHPYPEYSEVFFGGAYRVLRGGSWATRPAVIRNSFRNWDHPYRRQIHAGFRCARSR